MIHIAELTADEKWAIRQQIKNSQVILVREKAQAVLLSDMHLESSNIAKVIGKTTRTVNGWLKNWNEMKLASLFSGHTLNENAAKLTTAQKEQIKEALQNSPSDYGIPKEFWDVATLKKYLKAEFQIVYESRVSYHILLRYSNLSFKYPDTFDRHRDELRVKARIATINKEIMPILRDDSWELFCVDEVRLQQEAEIRRAWLKKGEKTIVKVNRQQEHQNYIGFLSQKDFRCYVYKLDWQNSEEILEALKRFLYKFPTKRLAIIWDNASFHRSKEIKTELKKGGLLERVHLIAMPPYAPDENPIEHVWNTAKKHHANIQHDTFDETKTKFENFVRNKTFKYSFRGVNRKYL